ncbi:class I SAM-dependent methyltransferase [Reichenbachiella sp. MALMAid0571]|uniref:class I SAM-dependent methyltransferase n=1 Tax=Reichenbachiella sp. MALMAid0571 TaxID=3143939 RepID=UPI0032DE9770
METFKDHFSGHSSSYQKYRPAYPVELYQYISGLCEEHDRAWDAGTGNGQCALRLVDYFDHVLATDPSANQIKNAVLHNRIKYHVSRAENCPVSDSSMDLVTVAQAIHWFDFDLFFKEVKRVLKPNGVLAFWTYTLAEISPEVDEVTNYFYRDIVGKYWPKERNFVEDKYQGIPMPFEEIQTPAFEIKINYNMHNYLAYLGTWSAVKNFKTDNHSDPIDLIKSEMSAAWINIDEYKVVTWPIYLRAGRI